MANIERVNLRLNLDDPRDAAIWDLVKDKKNKKGTYIKFLIYNLIVGNEISTVSYTHLDVYKRQPIGRTFPQVGEL